MAAWTDLRKKRAEEYNHLKDELIREIQIWVIKTLSVIATLAMIALWIVIILT